MHARLPVRDLFDDEAALAKTLDDAGAALANRCRAARDLAFSRRAKQGQGVEIGCLSLGPGARILHLPGELFVEYQLAAQKMLPQATVCMAAYGGYGPGYIGAEVSYDQGGYETGPASRTAPQVEGVLLNAIAEPLR